MIHVLIDIDETMLSVPEGINKKASARMFKQVFGLDAHEEMIDNVGKTEMGIIKEVLEKVGIRERLKDCKSFFVEVPEEAYKVWAQATTEELKDNPVKVLPGVPQLLDALSKNPNVKLGLLSGNSKERAEAKLKSAQLDVYFRNPETGQLNGVFGDMAPRRDQLFDIVKKQTTAEDHFVLIDDSLIGAKMSEHHNIPVIMVATGKATEQQLKHFTSHVFSDFGDNRWQEVVSVIEKL